MHEIASSGVLITVGRQRGFKVADAVQLQSAQHTAHGGWAHPELERDPYSGPTLSP
jgi:hypothetical protein